MRRSGTYLTKIVLFIDKLDKFPPQHQIHSDDPKEVVLRVQQLLLQQLPAKRAGLQNSNLLKVSTIKVINCQNILESSMFYIISPGAESCTKVLL